VEEKGPKRPKDVSRARPAFFHGPAQPDVKTIVDDAMDPTGDTRAIEEWRSKPNGK
jgi:hypothetical protein